MVFSRRRTALCLLLVTALAPLTALGATSRPAVNRDHAPLGNPTGSSADIVAWLNAETPRDPAGRTGSGGRVVVHQANGKNARAGTARALLHRTGMPAIEPTLGVLKDGSVFVQNAMEDPVFGFRPVVQVTRNQGRTFTDISPQVGGQLTHPVTQDPYLYAEPKTGRVFTVDYVGCGHLSSTSDRGESWSPPTEICSNLTDHQTLFGGPPVTSMTTGYPHVLYYCAVTLIALNKGTSAGCDKSIDGGLSWVPTGAPAFTPEPQYDDTGAVMGWCSGLIGHGTVGPDGTIYIPKACSSPYLLVSRDEGLTWTKQTLPAARGVNTDAFGFPDHEAAVAVDGKGVVYYFWMGRDRKPYLTYSRDRGATWSRPIDVAPPGVDETVMPTIAVTPNGRVALAYLGTTESPGKPFPNDSTCWLHDASIVTDCSPTAAKKYKTVRWNGYLTVTDDLLRPTPTFTTARVNAADEPFTIGECGPFRCQQQYDFIDVQLGPDGTPWAIYSDGCRGDTDRCVALGEGVVGRIAGLRRHG